MYRDLPPDGYVAALESVGLNPATAGFIAAIDTSIAAGDLETDRDDLARLLRRPVTTLADAVRAAVA